MNAVRSIAVVDATTLVITRALNAPRALVRKMFADPCHLAQWWGRAGFINRVEHLDFPTGGRSVHVRIGPDGRELLIDSDIFEVTPPGRIELLGDGKQDENWDGSNMNTNRLAILPGVTPYNIFLQPSLFATAVGFLDA